MKQKIVIKVQMRCEKCRTEAMTIAALADGVNSVAISGKDKDQVVVTGEDIDSAKLTCLLRKKFGCAVIISVAEDKPEQKKPVVEKQVEKKPVVEKPVEKKPEPKCCKCTSSSCCQCPRCTLRCEVVYDPNPKCCKFTSSSCCQCPQCTLRCEVVYDPNPPMCSIM